MKNDQAPVCASRSSGFNWRSEFAPQAYSYPQTRPSAVGRPGIILFPRVRAPRGDEGSDASGTSHSPLQNARVLVVEDDFIVGVDMQMILEEQGAVVLGPAASLAQARELLTHDTPQVAILDVNLNGELVFPLMDDLQKRGVVCIFATAYADDDRLFPDIARGAPRLAKPVLPSTLIGQISKMLR